MSGVLQNILSWRGYVTFKEKRHVKTEGVCTAAVVAPFATGGARLHAGGHGRIAVSIATGGAPADIDADAGVLDVIDHTAGQSHLSLFKYNDFGKLVAAGDRFSWGAR